MSGPKTVRFGSVNGHYQKCDGRNFILVSFHPGSKFSKKKPKHFKISEGRPKVLLYIFPNNNNKVIVHLSIKILCIW
jgi:hypothetical protein